MFSFGIARMLWVTMGMYVPFVAPSLTLRRCPCVTSVSCNIVRIALTRISVTMQAFGRGVPGGSSGGAQSKSSAHCAQCKDAPYGCTPTMARVMPSTFKTRHVINWTIIDRTA